MGIIMFEVIVMSDIVFMFVRLASMVDVPVLELLDCGCFPVGRLDVEPAGVGELVRLGAGVVKCVTAPSNVRMRGLLVSFGFVEKGLVVDYYGAGKDRLVYEFAV